MRVFETKIYEHEIFYLRKISRRVYEMAALGVKNV
jgi:hypothetical protein